METTASFIAGDETHAEPTPSGSDSRASSALLGAALALNLGGLGLVVPLVAAACDGVLKGLEQPFPPPTKMVISVGWWWIAVAVVIAGVLLAKERWIGGRRAAVMNAAILVLVVLVAACALLAVILPLLNIGNSLAPTY